MPPRTIIYYKRGQIERLTEGGYAWRDGYSPNGPDGGIIYPWLTKKEARKDAEQQGGKAVFRD